LAVTFEELVRDPAVRLDQLDGCPEPEFCLACGGGLVGFATHDVAVVILDEPVSLSSYARLPSLDQVDTLRMRQRATAVGYGVQDTLNKLDPGEAFTRSGHLAVHRGKWLAPPAPRNRTCGA
jgi:hypothetical protein